MCKLMKRRKRGLCSGFVLRLILLFLSLEAEKADVGSEVEGTRVRMGRGVGVLRMKTEPEREGGKLH